MLLGEVAEVLVSADGQRDGNGGASLMVRGSLQVPWSDFIPRSCQEAPVPGTPVLALVAWLAPSNSTEGPSL